MTFFKKCLASYTDSVVLPSVKTIQTYADMCEMSATVMSPRLVMLWLEIHRRMIREHRTLKAQPDASSEELLQIKEVLGKNARAAASCIRVFTAPSPRNTKTSAAFAQRCIDAYRTPVYYPTMQLLRDHMKMWKVAKTMSPQMFVAWLELRAQVRRESTANMQRRLAAIDKCVQTFKKNPWLLRNKEPAMHVPFQIVSFDRDIDWAEVDAHADADEDEYDETGRRNKKARKWAKYIDDTAQETDDVRDEACDNDEPSMN
jgi:hypothetical protein